MTHVGTQESDSRVTYESYPYFGQKSHVMTRPRIESWLCNHGSYMMTNKVSEGLYKEE